MSTPVESIPANKSSLLFEIQSMLFEIFKKLKRNPHAHFNHHRESNIHFSES